MDENTKQPLVATVIGTCRVHRPFQCLEREGLAIVKNRQAKHYLHTTKEILQYLRYLDGDEVIPDELAEYVTSGNLDYGCVFSHRTLGYRRSSIN